MRTLFFILLIPCFGLQSPMETEQLHFAVWQKGEQIGEVKAEKHSVGQEVYYHSFTETTTHSIIRITVLSDYEVHIQNGHLQTAEAKITVRGRTYAHTFTQFCDNQCEIIKDKKDIFNIDEVINYASTMLLFEEPLNVKNSYSELDGSLHPMEALGNHQYKKTDIKGRQNIYRYKDGQLLSAQIDAGLIEFEIRQK